ncbi:PH domain-containing protein [Nocardia sp. alder85J]|uniref:PH domain-containing protein n=1 Tax=Nocardia sp. alder85J TaxID=2862949 RepID=UPI001CD3E756|nr:PH domain-containing protein [Nocardia sp. alder85J]MCX4096551.1 PH domain-containing protein [Nocardia sp. alder85J]
MTEQPQVGPRLTWSTPLPALIVATLGAVALGVAAVLSTDPPGRLLIGLGAVLLLVLALIGFRQRPRLEVRTGTGADGPRLIVRGVLGPVEYAPEQIRRARVVSFPRLGRRVPNLELDVEHRGDERLLIFGRWDLGTHPQDVLDALVVHRLARLSDAYPGEIGPDDRPGAW